MEIVTFPNRPKTDKFTLQVPYNNQIDNSPNKGQGPGYRQCNLTSAAMLAKYCKPALWGQYEDFANGFQDVLSVFGDTTDHGSITEALSAVGIESYFSYAASIEDVAKSLFLGLPVMAGTKYKAAGHMILFIGRTPEYVIAHDPYGSRNGMSDTWLAVGEESGKLDTLRYHWLNNMVFDLGSEAGWCRFVTAVDGMPTGLPLGM